MSVIYDVGHKHAGYWYWFAYFQQHQDLTKHWSLPSEDKIVGAVVYWGCNEEQHLGRHEYG